MKETKQQSVFSRTLVAIPLAMFACLLWGSAFPCVKIGYRLFNVDTSAVPNIWMYAGVRFTMSGILIIAIMSLINRRFLYPKNRSQCAHVFWLSLTQTSLQYGFYYIGLSHIAGIKASIMNGLGVIILLAISAFIFRQEKLTAKKVTASLIGLSGILLMNLGGSYGGFSMLGEGFIIISIVSANFSTCLMKEYSASDNPVMLSGWQFFIGGLTLVALAAATGGSIHPVSPSAYAMMLYLASLSAVAYTIWSIILKHNPVSRIAMCKFMVPVFGVILSAIMLGEPLTLMCAVALVLVSLSIIITNKQ